MPTLLNISRWAQLVVWFYHSREIALIHLKFPWGFLIHTKRIFMWPYNLAVGNIVSPDNPKCLICVYSNVTSLVNHLTLSVKEKGRVYKRKPNTGKGLSNLVIYMTQFHGKNGLAGLYMHEACYISISSLDKLDRARQRKKKTSSYETEVGNSQCDDETDGQLPPKLLRSSICGPLHDKTKCVWCMQGVDKKHPDRTRGKMFRLNTQSAWRAFKRHTVLIEDRELRDPLSRRVKSTSAISDPFANDIMYHHSCWCKYISQTQFEPADAIHLQGVCLSEARNLFFKHVDEVIFPEREIRSLQSLFSDYKRIVNDYGYAVGDVRSSYVKKPCWSMSTKRQLGLKRGMWRTRASLCMMLQEGVTTLRLQSFSLAPQMTTCLKMWHLDSRRRSETYQLFPGLPILII